MTKLAIRTLLILLALSLSGIALAADTETLTGEFVWTRDDGDETGDLEAIFTVTGEGAYDVVFHFDWEGEPRTWKGTAKGSLEKGKLEGEVLSDFDDPATFTFSGKFKKGAFQGTHGQVTKDGELKATGTMTLGR
jgi:hypothetical protein